MSFGFGLPSSTAPTTSFGFGTSTANKPTGFGTAFNFGAPTSSAAPAFGLGSNTSTASTGFTGFGTTAPGSTGFSFGSTGAPASTSTGFTGFGGFGATTSAPSTGFGNFGATSWAPSSTGLFSNFGQPATTNAGFGGFGTSFGTKPVVTSFSIGGPNFGLPQQQQQQPSIFGQPQQQQQLDPYQAVYNSVYNCQIFGDERDKTLATWNLLQALWGVGKGYYSQHAPPIEYDMKNPLCRFKSVAYSIRPRTENKDGLVALVFNKKESEMRSLEAQLITNLNSILGNKPNLSLCIESVKPFCDTKSIVMICVEEKTPTGTSRKIPASELSNYLLQPLQKQQLSNLQVENVYSHVDPGQEQLKEYLDNPPVGIDAHVWKQAQDDNPNPQKLIPVPLVGFQEVRWRMKCQEQETALHQAFLDKMAEEIDDLQRKHTDTIAKINEHKRRFAELQHRILKVLIVQEISRKMGLSLLPEEEKLKSRLETVYANINSAPFKNRLMQLTEEVKSEAEQNRESLHYIMDPAMIPEIKQFLTMEQSSMTHIMDTIQSDMTDAKMIKDGMIRILQGQI